jgi:hypothetical protein
MKVMAATYKSGSKYPVFIVEQTPRGTFGDGEKQVLCQCPSFTKAMRTTSVFNNMIAAARGLI